MLLLHEIKMLPLELENEAMLRILGEEEKLVRQSRRLTDIKLFLFPLGRVGPLPEEDGKTISELDLLLDFSSTFEASVRYLIQDKMRFKL